MFHLSVVRGSQGLLQIQMEKSTTQSPLPSHTEHIGPRSCQNWEMGMTLVEMELSDLQTLVNRIDFQRRRSRFIFVAKSRPGTCQFRRKDIKLRGLCSGESTTCGTSMRGTPHAKNEKFALCFSSVYPSDKVNRGSISTNKSEFCD